MTNDVHEPQRFEVSCLSMCGWMREDGSVELTSGKIVETWPPKVRLLGVVFDLIRVQRREAKNNQKGILQEAFYG